MRQLPRFLRIVSAFGLMCLLSDPVNSAVAADVAKWIPDDANALVIVDADRLFNSALGQKEGWGKPKAADFAGRPVLLTPNTLRLVRAGSMNFDTMEAPSQVALLSVRKSPTLETIAKNEKGYVESVGNTRTAWSPRGAYAVNLDTGVVGVVFPANRQYLSRWMKQRRGQASSYLLKALTEFDTTKLCASIVFDLDDALAAGHIEHALAHLKCMADKKSDLKAIAASLESVRGVKLGITIADKATGKLVIDFNGSSASLQAIAKPLVIEVIAELGYELDDMETWKQTSTSNSITLEGDLSRSGLMRLSSLCEAPHLALDESGRDADQADSGDPKLYATQSHYKSVQALLDDLGGKKKETFGQAGKWCEQYAQRIDRLPIVHVDDDMLKYSANVSGMLRDMGLTMRGVGIRTASRQADVYGSGVTYNYRGQRLITQEASATQAAIKTQERSAGAMDARQIRQQIDIETAAIRKVMSQRYKIEF